jgi:hypothetical protein
LMPATTCAGIKEVLEQTQDMSVPAGLRYANVWNAAFLPSPNLTELLADALRGGSQRENPC